LENKSILQRMYEFKSIANIKLRSFIKTIERLVLLLLTSSALHAESQFEGFYEQAGIGFTKTNFNLTTTPLTVSTYSFPTSTSVNNTTNLSGELSAGYFKTIKNNFLLGLMVDAHPFASPTNDFGVSIATTPTASTVSGGLKNQGNMALNLTPAWEITAESLAYLKLGYVWGTIQKNTTLTSTSGVTTSTQSLNLTGTNFGFGFKRIIDNQLFAFTEINIVYKNDSTQANSIPITLAGHSLTANYSATAGGSYYNALVGLGYRF